MNNEKDLVAAAPQNIVWVVLSGDYGGDWVEMVYATEVMANAHVAELGGYVTEHEISNVLHPDVSDPAKKAEREAAAEKNRRDYEARNQHDADTARQRAEVKPWGDKIPLCKCQTYEQSYDWINTHGYCTFCGGFTIAAYRAHLGEEALQAEIDEFNLHDRTILRRKAAEQVAP